MAEFLYSMAFLVLVAVATGLFRILRGPDDADRVMAAQALGSGGIAMLLLVGEASGGAGAIDVALVLALLAALASVGFVAGRPPDAEAEIEPEKLP
jgi:multicomponent Na+:H+ antiporter subunit F